MLSPIPSTHLALVVGALGSVMWHSHRPGVECRVVGTCCGALGSCWGMYSRGVELHGNMASNERCQSQKGDPWGAGSCWVPRIKGGIDKRGGWGGPAWCLETP